MNEFMQTFLIAVIPACITGVVSFFASRNTAKSQIETINEQNKADIQKLIEQHKVDIEVLKEKHKMELELKEKDHLNQLEIIKLQHDNNLKREEENAKYQMAANAIGGMFENIFSQDSPFSEQIKKAIDKSLEKSKDDN